MVMKSKHEQRFDEIKKQEEAFKTFYDQAAEIFDNLQAADPTSQIFKDRCMLHVCPGSRAGGDNPDVVDMFWGAQPVKRVDRKHEFKLLSESGVTMLFNLLPDGHVTITLYPAQTEVMKPIETCILLHRFCKATWLLEEKNQKALWRDFMAYTECTSLIGAPSWKQRLRMAWVKYSRPVYINGVQTPIKGLHHLRQLVSFALTVGFSGCLLYCVQQCNEEEPVDYTPSIEKVCAGIEGVQEEQGNINTELQTVKVKLDSLLRLMHRRTEQPRTGNAKSHQEQNSR